MTNKVAIFRRLPPCLCRTDTPMHSSHGIGPHVCLIAALPGETIQRAAAAVRLALARHDAQGSHLLIVTRRPAVQQLARCIGTNCCTAVSLPRYHQCWESGHSVGPAVQSVICWSHAWSHFREEGHSSAACSWWRPRLLASSSSHSVLSTAAASSADWPAGAVRVGEGEGKCWCLAGCMPRPRLRASSCGILHTSRILHRQACSVRQEEERP